MEEIVELLLEHGCEIDATSSKGQSALMAALEYLKNLESIGCSCVVNEH
jgi:ankyrin repeat protein